MIARRAGLGAAALLAAFAAAHPAASRPVTPVATIRAHGLSATLARSPRGDANFQYFLTVSHAGHTVLSSPGDRARLIPRLLHFPGDAARWFPQQEVRLVGVARLAGLPFVVIVEHNTAADCGWARVGLVGPDGRVVVIDNACGLDARIGRDRLILSGPYYGPGAPLADPTIPHATATLARRHGHFTLEPGYFQLRRLPAR